MRNHNYNIVNLASPELPVRAPDGVKLTEFLIPSVLTQDQCLGKFLRGLPGPTLLPVFFASLKATAYPLMLGMEKTKPAALFQTANAADADWAVECVQLAGELVHGEPAKALYFPGTPYEVALAAVFEAALNGRPLVFQGFDFLGALDKFERTRQPDIQKLKADSAKISFGAPDYADGVFACHLASVFDLVEGKPGRLAFEGPGGEITLTHKNVRPGFFLAFVLGR